MSDIETQLPPDRPPRRRRLRLAAIALITLAAAWIVSAWALERWGGTICVGKFDYISRDELLLVGADYYASGASAVAGQQLPLGRDWPRARQYLQENPSCCRIRRQISLRNPSTFAGALLFPFRRYVEIPPIPMTDIRGRSGHVYSAGLLDSCQMADHLS